MKELVDILADSLHEVIGLQAQSYLAKVITAPSESGTLQAHSQVLGNIVVLCRTTDRVEAEDWIWVRKAKSTSYSQYLYAGWSSSGNTGSTTPSFSPSTPIHVPVPNEDGAGTADAGTLQFYLDTLATAIKAIKGTDTWDTVIAQSLTELLGWRGVVTIPNDLPLGGNRTGDIRYCLSTYQLYVWTGTVWSTEISTAHTVQLTAGDTLSIGQLLALDTNAVPADATTSAHMGKIIGIARNTAVTSAPVRVQTEGIATGSFGSYRGPLWVGLAGALAMSIPEEAIFAQQIGTALSSTTWVLHLDSMIVEL